MLRSKKISAMSCFSLLVVLSQQVQSQTKNPFETLREKLVTNVLIPNGIKDPRVLKSMGTTPRHEFVPPIYKSQAYQDIAIPIGESQTISSPFIVAFMTQALNPQPTDKVLEIGTGSGYQAAILSPLVQEVYTIEIVEKLGLETTELLEKLSYTNVHCRIGDGFKGWEEHAPFDKIIVTCSPEDVPAPLVKQLKDGGLMVIPVGERYQQMLCLMRKSGDKLEKDELQPTLFVPMTGTAEDQRKVMPPPNPVLLNVSFEVPLINNVFIPGWYYQFGCVVVQDNNAPDGGKAVEFRSNNGSVPSMLLQGVALDGSTVKKIKLGGWIATENVKFGADKEKSPSIAIQFFDANRNRVGYNFIGGGFKGTRNWKQEERIFSVPATTKEAIVSIGLFGAEGMARFDNISLETVR
jgi:protein-L-isoaspartate(D-aspartate) O-methyltransferase